MNDMAPEISVIMPVYNAALYLRTAIDSVLSQSFKNLELILVDDGSKDDSPHICDEYAQKDMRVVVIHQENGGVCRARNSALKIAKGRYVAFADNDDEYLPGFLQHAYDIGIKYDADLVKAGKIEYILKNDKVVRKMSNRMPDRVYDRNDIKMSYFELVDSRTLDCVWDGLYKKELLKECVVLFDENLKHGGEDIVFNQQLLPYINSLITIGEYYYVHYIRRGFSTSSKFNRGNILMFEKKMSVIKNSIQELHISLEAHAFEYTYLLFRQYVVNLCAYYSNKQLEMSRIERIRALVEIQKSPFYFTFCNQQSSLHFFRKSLKYGILYLSYKYRLFRFILWMFGTL